VREREGLIARVTQMRRAAPADEAQTGGADHPDAAVLETLQRRIAELEALVQGLQDSVHRESLRQRKRLDDLEARTEPSALAVALSADARERGI
jgi:hypothetical protein